jgi:outer membrane protein assembly factor BamE
MSTLLATYIKSPAIRRACPARASNPAAAPLARPSGDRTGGRIRRAAALLAIAAVLPGCASITHFLPGFLTPYRPDVQQGNVITNEMVEQLRPGMTREQVRFMLGTPLLADAFHKDRWDYLYYLNPRVGSIQRRNLVIYFADNRLDHFQSDAMPPESMADNLILGRKGKPNVKPKEPAVEPAAAAAAEPAPAEAPTPAAEPAPAAAAPAPETAAPASPGEEPAQTPTPPR